MHLIDGSPGECVSLVSGLEPIHLSLYSDAAEMEMDGRAKLEHQQQQQMRAVRRSPRAALMQMDGVALCKLLSADGDDRGATLELALALDQEGAESGSLEGSRLHTHLRHT